MKKNRFFANHSKSSAMVVSMIIHAVIIVAAISFVVVKVKPPKDPKFTGMSVEHRQPPPPPPRVPTEINIKPTSNPKFIKPVPTPVKDSFVTVEMPDVAATGMDLGPMGVNGIECPNLVLRNPFGEDTPTGNELAGTFYDLKQTKKGKSTEMTDGRYIAELNKFAKGWNLGDFRNYFQAPVKKHAFVFMIPTIDANAAPKAYEVDNVVKPRHWVAYYTGKILPEETGYYRFCGFGDDVLLVRVRSRLVLDASYPRWEGKVTNWHSDDKNSRKYPLGEMPMVIGDWVKLHKDKPSEIEILLGECPGGKFSCQLLIEQKGKEYQQTPFVGGTRPILPVFKTKQIPRELIEPMQIDPNQATIEGPSFGVIK